MFRQRHHRRRWHCLCPSALPSTGWPMVAAEQRGPFGPVPLQNLRPYYEPLRPCAPHRYSGPLGFSQLDFSLCIGTTGSHVPHESLMRARAVYMPDAARAGSGHPPNLSRGFGVPPVSTSPDQFRHFSNGSLALAFPHLTCRDLVPTFPQRSPRSLFTAAACGGLEPAPDRRLRGAYPHLSYSTAPPLLLVRS